MNTAADSPRMARIRAVLTQALTPTRLELVDDSHQHAGHAGARQGGHFTLRIAAPGFAGKRPLECHRMIYAALGELMQTDIHALSIDLLPDAQASIEQYPTVAAAGSRKTARGGDPDGPANR